MKHSKSGIDQNLMRKETISFQKLFSTIFTLIFFFSTSAVFALDPSGRETEEQTNNFFIDKSLKDAAVLEAGLSENDKTFHLFSHGKSGELLLNGKWLNAEQLVHWFTTNEFLENATYLNIYGCDFAKGEEGLAAVVYLENELNITIAASTNVTGKDGDWVLEYGQAVNAIERQAYRFSLQLDTVHYLPPHVAAIYSVNAFRNEYLYLSTPSIANISVVVTDGGGTPITGSPFTISNATPLEITLGNIAPNVPISVDRSILGTVMSNVGLIASSSSAFYAEYRQLSGAQAASVSSKGTIAMGTSFKWAGARSFQSFIDVNNYISIFAVESSNITISGINPATQITGVTHSGTISVSLAAGESVIYDIHTPATNLQADIDGMLGADIVSTGNIVINSGGQSILAANGSASNAKDHGIDQMVPTKNVGRFYAAIRGASASEKVYITATANNTDIFLNGVVTPFITINDGEYALIPANQFIGGSMYIEASEPVYVFHSICGQTSVSTQGLVFLPPLNGFAENIIAPVPFVGQIDGFGFGDTELRILARAGIPVQVSINGGALTNLASPQNITGTTQWEYYIIDPVSTGDNYSFFSTAAIQVSSIGASNVIGFSSYHGGFANIPIISRETNCNNILTASSGVWDSYQWYLDGVLIPGAISQTYTATAVGDYFAIVSLSTDPGVEQETNRIAITADNPDTDNDGINDICDLDDDNDGILDSDENPCTPSALDYSTINTGSVSFTDIYNPLTTSLVDADITVVTGAVTANYGGNSINFGRIGGIEAGDELHVEASLLTPITLTASTLPGQGTLNDGDFLRLTSETGFTINDPSNELTVVTISPTQIEINTSATAFGTNATWSVSSVTTLFQVEMLVGDPRAAIDISIGCQVLDTDGDNIPNFKDPDSDNDGCNDVHEAGFTDAGFDGVLGDGPTVVNDDGLVIGTNVVDGYTGTTSEVTDSVAIGSTICAVILPVELVNFQAIAQDNRRVALTWQTVSEKDNDYFEIYKSTDLKTWEYITSIDGAGNSDELLEYSANDLAPFSGASYYKLIQVDFDGTVNFGEIRSVEIDVEIDSDLSIYPNPTSGELKITGEKEQLQNLQLLNSLGQQIKMSVLVEGNSSVTIDISNLESGVYFMRSDDNTYKIIKN